MFLRCPSFLANLLRNFFLPNFKIPRQIITGDQAGCHISLLLRCERDSLPITGPTHTLEQAKRKWKEVTILVHQPQYFDHSFRVGLAVVVPELSQIRQSLSFPPTTATKPPISVFYDVTNKFLYSIENFKCSMLVNFNKIYTFAYLLLPFLNFGYMSVCMSVSPSRIDPGSVSSSTSMCFGYCLTST